MFIFDELNERDLAVVMSHVNSNPREKLCGMSPIQMFLAAFGDDGQVLLDAFGIEQKQMGEINLTPEILNTERSKRGEDPLTKLSYSSRTTAALGLKAAER